MQSNYSHHIEENVVVIKLTGDLLGEKTGPELVGFINDQISRKIINAVIDISEVRYINSSGIGVLITILTKFRNKGGEVVLVNPSEHVKKLLVITKLNAIFSIVESKEEALSKIKN